MLFSDLYYEERENVSILPAHTYTCPYCSYTTWHASNYKRHVLKHTGERPYKCTVCQKSFNRKDNLQTHLILVHSTRKPHVCSKCKFTFLSISELENHKIDFGH
ncbi:Zinc finger and BTB domain-containing protein 8B, partial [Stegodyphus mimosarum]